MADTRRRATTATPPPKCKVRDYPAFTIRLPWELYAELRNRAERDKRSLAAQVEIELERKFAA